MNKKQWIGLLMIYISYLLLGAGVFYTLEHDREQTTRSYIIGNFTELQTTLSDKFKDDELIKIRAQLGEYCGKSFEPGTLIEDVVPIVWNFYNAFFFVITVVSTIGYGNFHPSTDLGRAIMIVYALVGIPLNGILLTSLGQFFGAVFLKAHKRYKNHERYESRWGLTLDILTYLMPGVIVFIFLPAGVLTYFEEWTYIESVYYAFVTLTTIGFGDLVAGQQQYADTSYEAIFIYKGLIFCWVIFGLGYLIMLLGFVAQGMNSKKFRKLEKKLLTTFTHSRMWHGFSKDIGYLRRLMNEMYLEKLKPVFRDEETPTPPIIHRSSSLPNFPTIMSEEDMQQLRQRHRTMSENIPSLTRVFSESDLQRIDKNKTFAAPSAAPTTIEFMRRIIDVYGAGQMKDWSFGENEVEEGSMRGIDGFSDEEVLASERAYDQHPTITVTSRHPSSIFQLPSYEDTVSRQPHRGRAMSECPPVDRKKFPQANLPSGSSDWTWSGPAANKLHDVIRRRSKQKMQMGLNTDKNSLAPPGISVPDRFDFLRNRKCVSDQDTSTVGTDVDTHSLSTGDMKPAMFTLPVPDFGRKRQSLQEGRLTNEYPRDPRYMTQHAPPPILNPLASSGDLLQMYSRGDTLFGNNDGRDMLEDASIGDLLRALTSLHSRVGERLVASEQPKPRRKLGTASLTPPRIRSLLDLFEPPSPQPPKRRKPSAISTLFRSEGRKESMPNIGDDKAEKAEPSHFKRFGRFLLRSYSMVPKDMEEVAAFKQPGRKKRFSLWPTDSDTKDPPFQLHVDSPVESRRQSVDVVIPMEGSSSRRSSVSFLKPQAPSNLATSADSVFLRTPPAQRRISHPRWHMDSSLSDVKESKKEGK